MAGSKPFDVIIIGGDPAGLAAAVTLARQVHTVVLFDSGSYRNASANYMHTVPTWDHRHPEEFRAAGRKDVLENYETIKVQNAEIENIKQEDGPFVSRDTTGKVWISRKILLATGSSDIYPDLEGYGECWGSGIFHCLFCHGYEESHGTSSGILAIQNIAAVPPAMHMARTAAQLVSPVTIYTNGSEQLAKDMSAALGGHVDFKVDSRVIKRVSKGSKGAEVTLHFEDGSQATESFLGHNPSTKLNGHLPQQLGLKLTPRGDIKTSPPFLETSMSGVFAAGDCMTMFKVVPNAIANGSMAAADVSMQIQAEMYGHKTLF